MYISHFVGNDALHPIHQMEGTRITICAHIPHLPKEPLDKVLAQFVGQKWSIPVSNFNAFWTLNTTIMAMIAPSKNLFLWRAYLFELIFYLFLCRLSFKISSYTCGRDMNLVFFLFSFNLHFLTFYQDHTRLGLTNQLIIALACFY